jgi:hypothetical protein
VFGVVKLSVRRSCAVNSVNVGMTGCAVQWAALCPQFVEHQGVDTGIEHARERCRSPSGERCAGRPVFLIGFASAS